VRRPSIPIVAGENSFACISRPIKIGPMSVGANSFAQKKRSDHSLGRLKPAIHFEIFPEDVIDDLKRIAPVLGFSGYQPLIRAYVGQGLRNDLERLDNNALSGLVAGLKKRGVSQNLIKEALAELAH